MARLAPDGDTYQAGTLSGNPVAMTAGLATLDLLVRESAGSVWRRAAPSSSACCSRCWRARHFRCSWCGSARSSGSRFTRPVRRAPPSTLTARESARYAALFHGMLDRGVYLPPSAYETCFLSLAHTTTDLTRFATALGCGPGGGRMKVEPRLSADRARTRRGVGGAGRLVAPRSARLHGREGERGPRRLRRTNGRRAGVARFRYRAVARAAAAAADRRQRHAGIACARGRAGAAHRGAAP